jgi:hypothetical protein
MGDLTDGTSRHKHDTHAGRKRYTKIGGQFAPRLIDMLRSPAWCVLSLSGRRILDRVEIELADHGGTDNGKLPITYDDFERYGIDRHAIAPAIRECVALGFLEVTEVGRAGNAEWRKPNLFRLTYRNTNHGGPTHEWKRVTMEDATSIARMARKAAPQKQNSNGGKRQTPVGETPTENTNSIVAKPPLQAQCGKPPLLSIYREPTHEHTDQPEGATSAPGNGRSDLSIMDLMTFPAPVIKH